MHPYVIALIGGGLIGVSAVLLMALTGRIAGISGIVGGLLPPKPAEDRTWRIAFILGLLLAPTLLAIFTGDNRIGAPTVGPLVLIAAGLLVGVGTALAAVARQVTASAASRVCRCARSRQPQPSSPPRWSPSSSSATSCEDTHARNDHRLVDGVHLRARTMPLPDDRSRRGSGLSRYRRSAGIRRSLFVMGGGVAVAFVGYRFVLQRKQPLWAPKFPSPPSGTIDVPASLGRRDLRRRLGPFGLLSGAGGRLARLGPQEWSSCSSWRWWSA